MKRKRKKRPEPPRWFNLDTDNCWACKKNHGGCSGCHFLKSYLHDLISQKKQKHYVNKKNTY